MIRIHIPHDQYSEEILTWCHDNFGKPAPTGRLRWDSYRHTIFGLGPNNNFINGMMFIFYNDIDATAFKLKWT